METSNLNQNEEVPIINTRPRQRRTVGRWLTLAAIVVVIGAASIFVFMQRDGTNTVEAAAGPTVEITSAGFGPQTIKVKKGDTITWMNKDTQPHQIVADPFPTGDSLKSLNSGEPLAQNESYTATFEQTGTFSYHDQLNPATFKATIIVE